MTAKEKQSLIDYLMHSPAVRVQKRENGEWYSISHLYFCEEIRFFPNFGFIRDARYDCKETLNKSQTLVLLEWCQKQTQDERGRWQR